MVVSGALFHHERFSEFREMHSPDITKLLKIFGDFFT